MQVAHTLAKDTLYIKYAFITPCTKFICSSNAHTHMYMYTSTRCIIIHTNVANIYENNFALTVLKYLQSFIFYTYRNIRMLCVLPTYCVQVMLICEIKEQYVQRCSVDSEHTTAGSDPDTHPQACLYFSVFV